MIEVNLEAHNYAIHKLLEKPAGEGNNIFVALLDYLVYYDEGLRLAGSAGDC